MSSTLFSRKLMAPIRSTLLSRFGKSLVNQADTNHQDWLDIAILEETQDDVACREVQGRGQYLARQDMWDTLADEMRLADAERLKTPSGLPIADLLAFGARGDVVNAVEHALFEGHRDAVAPLVDGINEMEAMRIEYDKDPMLSVVVALTHIDIGWSWRTITEKGGADGPAIQNCIAHFDRASALLEAASNTVLRTPFIEAARCSLLAGRAQANCRVADEYAALVDLDPQNYRSMRAMGTHLLPRWFGSYPDLELEARRMAARTEKTWGAGAYTWVQFDAIALDDVACALVDVDFFVDGIHDIVARRPDQEMVNLLASYCAVALRNGYGESPESDAPREAIAECAQWLVRDHLRELHPLVWAHAADGYNNANRVRSLSRFASRGKQTAIRALEDLFFEDRKHGFRLTFTSDGLVREPV